MPRGYTFATSNIPVRAAPDPELNKFHGRSSAEQIDLKPVVWPACGPHEWTADFRTPCWQAKPVLLAFQDLRRMTELPVFSGIHWSRLSGWMEAAGLPCHNRQLLIDGQRKRTRGAIHNLSASTANKPAAHGDLADHQNRLYTGRVTATALGRLLPIRF